MMIKRYLLGLTLLILSLHLGVNTNLTPSLSHAQESDRTLSPFTPVTGTLNSETFAETWALNGSRGQPISLVAQATNGGLNPILNLIDTRGTIIATNDDERLNEFTARIENFILPEDGLYIVQVGRLGLDQGNTAGDYELLWLDGAGSIFTSATNLDTRVWLTRTQMDETVSLPELDTSNAYLQTNVQFTSAPDNVYQITWQFGMWYFSWSPDGRWQLDVIDATENVLDSVQGASDVLANPEFAGTLRFIFLNNTFQLIINNEVAVNHTTEANLAHLPTIPQARFSIDAEPNGSPSFAVRETYLTEFYYVEEGAEFIAIPPLAPDDYLWSYQGLPSAILDELVTAGLVPDGGGVNAIARDGYIYNYDVGFSAYPLFTEQRRFTEFVVGYTGIILEGSPATACGLLFNQIDGSNFATVMYTGQRELYLLDYVDGVPSDNSILLKTPYLAEGLETHNDFLLVVQDGTVIVYLNGRRVDQFNLTAQEGAMYVQLVLEEPRSANCMLQGLWVWEW